MGVVAGDGRDGHGALAVRSVRARGAPRNCGISPSPAFVRGADSVGVEIAGDSQRQWAGDGDEKCGDVGGDHAQRGQQG